MRDLATAKIVGKCEKDEQLREREMFFFRLRFN